MNKNNKAKSKKSKLNAKPDDDAPDREATAATGNKAVTTPRPIETGKTNGEPSEERVLNLYERIRMAHTNKQIELLGIIYRLVAPFGSTDNQNRLFQFDLFSLNNELLDKLEHALSSTLSSTMHQKNASSSTPTPTASTTTTTTLSSTSSSSSTSLITNSKSLNKSNQIRSSSSNLNSITNSSSTTNSTSSQNSANKLIKKLIK